MKTTNGIPPLTNEDLAAIFNLIADLLEIKGENVFKIRAYRKAADSLLNLSRPAYEIWQEGDLTAIDGIGKAIDEKIGELFETGKLDYLERLRKEVPLSLIEMLEIPGVGSKKVSLFWKELGITSIAELKEAAEQGKLHELPGMGKKTEAKILNGIAALARRSKRIPLGKAWSFAGELIEALRTVPDVETITPTGSLRRMKETVGDIDLLASSLQSEAVM